MKKIVVGIRIDEYLRDKLQKLAKSEGKTLSSYISEKIEDSISETERIDLLVRNMYEEVLKLGDMLSLMMGFNTETYATMISRISVDFTEAQLKASKERRNGVLKGLRKYLRETNERLNEGANVWIGEKDISEMESIH
ncbi:MAG: hypothetical protein IAA97_01910 [Spirochaetes bacterium]|uniref:Ribbon-helix-helix protein, CopG family n=1 Tax=Candidatus Ornithospirochaeta stercoripullorum TaxID=2840899 RepID=A0A9D9DWZ1_9SPIO|nr:hypothetical protein [Candidatus Ornithospirochaeta stercoripullorum]